LQLDLGYVRFESLRAGWFDRASATYSFNTQREERVNQGGQGDPNAAIVHQPERTSIHGVQANASRRISSRQNLLVGGDVYFEGHDSDSFDVNPSTGAQVTSRPRIPDDATYRQAGIFVQTDFEPNSRLALTGALRAGFNRYTAKQSDAPVVNGRPLWPDDELSTSGVTFRAGASFAATPSLILTGSVSSGYRAPHMTDLGTLGLTGSGFEVAAPDVAGLNGEVGTTADATAVATGRPVEQVDPETSINWDGGVRLQSTRVRASAGAFINTIDGNIQKQALILPPGAVGTMLGGQPITAQNANGVVHRTGARPRELRSCPRLGLRIRRRCHGDSSGRGRRHFHVSRGGRYRHEPSAQYRGWHASARRHRVGSLCTIRWTVVGATVFALRRQSVPAVVARRG
jgi:hemoglobin/transferrin/lactoferrin receptor protein